jgi:oxalate decarboxylase
MRYPLNRRGLLVSGAAFAAGAGGVKLASAGGAGATVGGELPAAPAAPSTDAGELPNLKVSFASAHTRVTPGGWTRQVTVSELPVATAIAGVQMHLNPGAIRELHWHAAGEWALMLSGSARVTAIDAQGRNFVDDVGAGDLWFFPSGLPHSIQGLEDGCDFLLVFDDGAFSEFDTFLLCDWFDHTPSSVLAKNFGLPEATFAHLPSEQERYIFPGVVPGPLSSDAVRSPAGVVPDRMTYRLSQQKPISCPGGRVRIVDASNFPASATIAAALVEVDPGGMRELHWHPNADEWQYYLDGQARMTVFGGQGRAATFDFQAGDVGSVPAPMGHYVENTGTTTLRFLELFRAGRYADVSLRQWLALTPPELVSAHLNIDRATIAALPRDKQVVVRG